MSQNNTRAEALRNLFVEFLQDPEMRSLIDARLGQSVSNCVLRVVENFNPQAPFNTNNDTVVITGAVVSEPVTGRVVRE
jgi:hypothetical protein